jgi:hypothetical protein
LIEKNKNLISIKLNPQKGNIYDYLLKVGNCIYPATPMFRKHVLNEEIFNTEFTCEGEAIFLLIAEKYKFSFVQDYLVVMREHSYNSGNNYELMFSDNIKWWTYYFNNHNNTSIKKYKNIKLSSIYLLFGYIFIEKNISTSKARFLILKSILLNKLNIFKIKLYIYILISYLPLILINKIFNFRKNINEKLFK